ncbi:ATP-binding protein [Aurantimonas sp. 22II-16-19i]|uniref:ATP-binding protein n=1 Tax=Aurantimonas sp. 22II-16-19i TaxID=1317114 RepID=UPI0009F7E3C4|nr:ATP-binding protein [Aurantimonas sp. 22II-16-19i]ORE97509.1 Signal transduction histidine kinase [Aurantimonas sp. 22II-16-19i]
MTRLLTLWRKSLSVQLLASMLVALFVSQAIGMCISWDKFIADLRAASRYELSSRSEAVARLVETVPPALQSEIARVNATDYTRFWISEDPAPDLEDWVTAAFERFQVPLRDLLNGSGEGAPTDGASEKTQIPAGASEALFMEGLAWTGPAAGGGNLPAQGRTLDFATRNGAGVIVPLSDGRALNVAYYKQMMPTIWKTHLPLALTLTAIFVSLIGVLTVRSIIRPLRQLTRAAETLGRGEAVTPLRACGPDDIRHTAEAFNRMQERLHRFVEDRTRMLAAIGHDLRTPLTTLRLRAELVEDPDLQERMLATIAEMQAMTEATLSLMRQETNAEPTRTIDLSALVESICEDLAEIGQKVIFVGGERVNYRCRPDGLRRSIRNLVENAVRYAGKAEVRLVSTRSAIEIVVEDDGPGIPLDRLEEVFAPFFRLEGSRSRETGGIGLGLSIARAIARQHGGDIVLSLRQPGLKAAIVLPA